MERSSTKNVNLNAWSTKTVVAPEDDINREIQEEHPENEISANGMEDNNKARSLSQDKRQSNINELKRIALIINVVGGIVASGILIDRASKCIQK